MVDTIVISGPPGASREDDDPYAGKVHVDSSVCYDLLASLRALFNPEVYERTRTWAATTEARLDRDLAMSGRFFFEGSDTALGYGAARLVRDLNGSGNPEDLVAAVSKVEPDRLAMYMLDTGETSQDRLARFRNALDGGGSVTDALEGLPRDWRRRCRRVLEDPEAVRDDLADLLGRYHEAAFAAEVGSISTALAAARPSIDALLVGGDTVEAIARLTGGYTLGPQLNLTSITLAPSVFMYPFMSTRVDELAGEALIVFGVPRDRSDRLAQGTATSDVIAALKALSDPNRLTVMGLLAEQPMFATELVKTLGLAQPTVHYHLTQLRSAGLVRQQREKGGMRYSLREGSAREILQSLQDLILGGRNTG